MADCSCRIEKFDGGIAMASYNHIIYCPLHAAAPELLHALRELLVTVISSRTVSIGSLNSTYELQLSVRSAILSAAREAIQKAEGV